MQMSLFVKSLNNCMLFAITYLTKFDKFRFELNWRHLQNELLVRAEKPKSGMSTYDSFRPSIGRLAYLPLATESIASKGERGPESVTITVLPKSGPAILFNL